MLVSLSVCTCWSVSLHMLVSVHILVCQSAHFSESSLSLDLTQNIEKHFSRLAKVYIDVSKSMETMNILFMWMFV